MARFSDATLQKFEVLRDTFGTIAFCTNLHTDRTIQGQSMTPDFRIKFRMLEGDVYLEHVMLDTGSFYTVEWHGKPESFGFRIQPDNNVWGPYWMHM